MPPSNQRSGQIMRLVLNAAVGWWWADPVAARGICLGQLFAEWGVRLTATCVGGYCAPQTPVLFYVDGHKRTGDPATIRLVKHEEIAIVIGTPPPEVPSSYDFQGSP